MPRLLLQGGTSGRIGGGAIGGGDGGVLTGNSSPLASSFPLIEHGVKPHKQLVNVWAWVDQFPVLVHYAFELKTGGGDGHTCVHVGLGAWSLKLGALNFGAWGKRSEPWQRNNHNKCTDSTGSSSIKFFNLAGLGKTQGPNGHLCSHTHSPVNSIATAAKLHTGYGLGSGSPFVATLISS